MGSFQSDESDVLSRLSGRLRGVDRRCWLSLLFTALFGLIAHGYCYANLLLTHDAVSVYYATPEIDAATGRVADTLVKALRGNVTTPWLIGFTSLAAIGFSAYLLVKTFDVKRPLFIACVCALLVTFPSVTCMNLFIFCADQVSLALMFACLSAYLSDKGRFGFLGGVGALIVSLLLYQAYLCVAATVMLLRLIMDVCFEDVDNGSFFKKAFRYLFVLLAGAGLYYLLWMAWLRISGIALSTYRGIDQVGQFTLSEMPALLKRTYALALAFLLKPGEKSFLPTYTLVSLWVGLLTVIGGAMIVAVRKRLFRTKKLQIAAAILCVCLLPLAMNLMNVLNKSADAYLLMQHAFVLPWIAVAVFGSRLYDGERPLPLKCGERTAVLMCAVLVSALMAYNGVLGANMSYVKAQANRESSLALTARLLDRLESEPCYTPQTDVVVVGEFSMGAPREGFDWCRHMPVAQQSGPNMYRHAMLKYLRHLDPSLKLAEEDAAYADLPAVRALASFPDANCTAWVDGTLVLKISEPVP